MTRPGSPPRRVESAGIIRGTLEVPSIWELLIVGVILFVMVALPIAAVVVGLTIYHRLRKP